MAESEDVVEFNHKKFPGDLYRSFKSCCALDKATMKSVLIELMTDQVERRERARARQKEAANA